MKCKHCGSDKVQRYGYERNGNQRYYCKSCKRQFSLSTQAMELRKIGIPIQEFRSKHDVDYIVTETLKKLSPDLIYEKSDIYKMTGLRAGYPGLSATLEDKKFGEYRGRVGGNTYWSHPETIKKLIDDAILQ